MTRPFLLRADYIWAFDKIGELFCDLGASEVVNFWFKSVGVPLANIQLYI